MCKHILKGNCRITTPTRIPSGAQNFINCIRCPHLCVCNLWSDVYKAYQRPPYIILSKGLFIPPSVFIKFGEGHVNIVFHNELLLIFSERSFWKGNVCWLYVSYKVKDHETLFLAQLHVSVHLLIYFFSCMHKTHTFNLHWL